MEYNALLTESKDLDIKIKGLNEKIISAKRVENFIRSQINLTKSEILNANTEIDFLKVETDVKVKKVKLHNIIDKGYYYIGRANPWDYGDSKTYYTIRSTEGEVIGTDPTPLMAANDYMFMIPQSLTAWDKSSNLQNCYFSIECTINGTIEAKPINFNGTAYIPFAPAWEAGTMYTVDILLGTGLRDGSGNKIF